LAIGGNANLPRNEQGEGWLNMTEQMHPYTRSTIRHLERPAFMQVSPLERRLMRNPAGPIPFEERINPFLCFVEGGEGEAGDGDPPADEKKFSQADLDKLVKRRLAQEHRKHEKAMKALEAKLESMSDLEDQLAELQAKLAEGDGDGDGDKTPKDAVAKAEFDKVMRELKKAGQALEKLTAENAELTTARDAAVGKYNGTRVADAARKALTGAGVMAKAQGVAVDTFIRELRAELHVDDDGKETIFLTDDDGTEHADIEDAAASFLKKHDYWKSHPGGGAGEGGNQSKNRMSTGGWKPGDLDSLDETAVLEQSFQK
jgi:hypothetical protein